MSEPEHEMAVVVMAYMAPGSVISAVRSILRQVPQPEILVVNSGGGDVQRQLQDAGIKVKVAENSRRLMPGGARNLGIHSTSAPYVAFLAADCTAEPGWVAERLKAHHQGHAVVASALLCHQPKNPIALAAHLSLFFRRMPRVPADIALAYGNSYDRRLFERHGQFREDMRTGEDTEFHLRLSASEQPKWWPEVKTVHVGTTSLIGFVIDQFRRGRHSAQAWYAINQLNRNTFARGALKRIPWTVRMAMKVVEPSDRFIAMMAVPFIWVGGMAYVLGALRANGSGVVARCDD